MKLQNISHPVTGSQVTRALTSSVSFLTNLIAMRSILGAGLLLLIVGVGASGFAQSAGQQNPLPFGVSNPKDKKWPTDEAARIYYSACDRVARSIRPVNPPHLRPSFVLVLGAQSNEMVRDGKVSEIRLKNWDPGAFAEAVVILAAREILSPDDMAHITHEALTYAQASVSASDLRQEP